MAYSMPRSAYQYMNDATFRSGPSVAPAYGTSRSKDPRIPHASYAPAARADYGQARYASYSMDYDQRSPYESEMYPRGHDRGRYREDIVQRTNQEAARSNSTHYRLSPHVLIHPMMCRDGGFPTGFSTPLPMEHLKAMNERQIEQILTQYGLPGGSSRHSNDLYGRESSKARNLASLTTLLEFLGARHLAELVRQRGGMQSMNSRRHDRMMLQY